MRTFAALLAITALIGAQAATAAELADGGRTSGAFVGAYLKLPFAGERSAPSPMHGGLKLSVVHQYRDARLPIVQYEADALDLRLGAEGRPALYLAGAPATDAAARLGYDDAAEGEKKGFRWWIPVAVLGGAALIGAAIFYAKVAEANRNSD